jgi:hypothetical protein
MDLLLLQKYVQKAILQTIKVIMNIQYIREKVKYSELKCKDLKVAMTYKEFKYIEGDLNIEFPQHQTKISDLVILTIKL